MAENLPTSIGKYEVKGIAGRGAQGVVYRAHDPFIDRAVAIKMWSSAPDDEVDEERLRNMRSLFFNEAQAAGSLDHPNILRVYDAGEADGEPYIVMEFVEGSHNLRQHCNPAAGLSVEQVVGYIRDCALALEHAHANGVVHRDIKPANIMLNASGDVKIVDFGIADRQRANATQVKSSLGSPRYMSPEQARGDKVGRQSDLYSLGTVLFELLAGEPPFQRKGIPSLLYAIAYEEPQDIRTLRPDLPQALFEVVNKALRKSTDARYQDGGSFAADLAAVFEEPAPEADDEPADEDKFRMLRPLQFLEPFTDDELWEFIEAGEWCKFRTGQEVVVEEDADDALYILISGRVGVSRGAAVLGEINAGECLGEIGYVLDEPRVSTITAVKSSVALRIDEPVADWASFTCQLKLSKQIQHVLAMRLSSFSRKAAEARGA
jgi:eukaryotic-like serine/threonine-protein kinase